MMRFLTAISLPLLLVFAFSATPTTAAFACENGANCCKKEVKKEADGCCKLHGDHEKNKGCGDDCGKKGCPCPQSAPGAPLALPPASVQFSPRQPRIEQQSKAEWYFLNKIPAAVHLSVWLPPKI